MARRRILPIDELNVIQARLTIHFDKNGRIKSREDCEEIIDELLALFLLAYANGVDEINEQFGTAIAPSAQELQAIVYAPVDGATWRDRVLAWYAAGGTIDEIMRIAETEAHRIGNTAEYETAVKAGATKKKWLTMLDDRVRDTHVYLESVSVPIDAEFYTFDGDHAPAPGLFQKADNNVGCRCELEFE